MCDRYRKWYDYERDCNAKCLQMVASVPEGSRLQAEFQKAVDKLAHLVAARQRWLHRLGHFSQSPSSFPKNIEWNALATLVGETESAWASYLGQLTDLDLGKVIEWETPDGKRLRWDLESILTQTFGHAWYHRGQIAQLVAQLGGQAVDTDYYFWSGPQHVSG
jgi:uncharacterized damage-inducible protein DinB